MNKNEIFYFVLLPGVAIIIICVYFALYFLVNNEQKAGYIKKIEDAIFFLPKKLFFIEGVTFKVLLGIGFIVLCFILIIKFLNCDTIIEKLAPCNPTDSAQYLNNVVNTISGILTPLFSLLAVIAAYLTLRSQRKQNAIQNFENHLFQMIDQQHKLEEKVVDKYGSFRKLYMDFCRIYTYVNERVDEHFKENGKKKEIKLKIANYIFYFGADEGFMCDKTFDILTDEEGEYKLNKDCLEKLIYELNGKKEIEIINNKISDLFHTQKSEELGIYYRNLFNAIRYIDWEFPYDDEKKKKEYAKLVRTNLSDFAQLMLYYNMQGERGSAWLDENEVKNPKHTYSVMKNNKRVDIKDCLLTRYLPIKNCAISVKNKDIDPRNDCRNEDRKALFSDDVIDYELKIGD